MTKKAVIIYLLSYCLALVCIGQTGLTHKANIQDTLFSGYFIEYRGQIKSLDPDVVPCRQCYYKYYSKNLTDSLLFIFAKPDSSAKNFICIAEPYGMNVIGNEKKALKFYSDLEARFSFDLLKNNLLFNNRDIPESLVKDNHSFINIYYGKLYVVKSAMLTENGYDGQLCDTYFYIPNSENNITYLYSVIFKNL